MTNVEVFLNERKDTILKKHELLEVQLKSGAKKNSRSGIISDMFD